MCLTIPGKIISIKEGIATVKGARETAQIDLGLIFGAKVGDWILYATNRAVKVISKTDAKEIIALLEDHYHPVDVSKLSLRFKKIIFKVRSQESGVRSKSRNAVLTKDEIVYLLNLKGKESLETLYAEANSLRKEMLEDFVCIHGIIEFSNHCQNSCLYCGIRKENKVCRYRMSLDEIFETAKSAVEEGYKLLVLQSGEDSHYSDDDLLKMVKMIKEKLKVFVFLSVGERSLEFYQEAYVVGATGALIRFESSNADFYAKMRPNRKLEDRLNLIRGLKKIGYYIASGSLIGLPGQTIEDIADDLLMIKKLGIPMISAGPYIAAKNTPLQISKSKFLISNQIPNPNTKFQNIGNDALLDLTLKYIAVARFMMPEIKIPVTTALETLDPEEGRHKGLLAGANALMFNLTPEKYAGNYSIYDNKFRDREGIWQKYGLFQGEESWEMLEERLMIK